MRCLFCRRIQANDQVTFNETALTDWDPPDIIVEEALRAQQRIFSRYRVNEKRDDPRDQEALHPKHAAISLAGEPTLYPELGDQYRSSFVGASLSSSLTALCLKPSKI